MTKTPQLSVLTHHTIDKLSRLNRLYRVLKLAGIKILDTEITRTATPPRIRVDADYVAPIRQFIERCDCLPHPNGSLFRTEIEGVTVEWLVKI